MAAHAMGYPRRRRWPRRLLGVLGTAAFLGCGVAIAMMVMQELEDETPAPQPRQGAAVKGATKTQPPPLTRAQKKARKAAVAKLAADGYEPVRLATWRPGAPLKVVVGRNDSGAMRAFFFSGARFIGYDDPATSTSLRVVKTGANAVTLAYKVTTGGSEKVRFEFQDGAVEPTITVPAASIR
jgi:hypothetical protein